MKTIQNMPFCCPNATRPPGENIHTSGMPCEAEKEKIDHLTAVIQSIRDINRMIIKEKRPSDLIRGICDSLIRNRGFHSAWILLMDEDSRVLASAESGMGRNLDPIVDLLNRGEINHCIQKVLTEAPFIVVRNPLGDCKNCPLASMYADRGGMSARLEHEGKIYGVLTVSVPIQFIGDPEEHELFKDVADDIGFALHGIEVEEERKKTEIALRDARDKLQLRVRERTRELEILSSRLISAQEEERKRIAGDLHDGIGQCLSAVKFMVETALERLSGQMQAADRKPLEALVPLLREASEDVRTIVMNLRPSILDDLGILATIGWFCRQFRTVYSYIQVNEAVEIEEIQIPDMLKTIIFRILQEAMNNVAKHSGADRVDVSLTGHGDCIELSIKDNGRGFDTRELQNVSAVEKGFGITGMKERAELTGGVFELISAPEQGALIRAAWTYHDIRAIH